MSDVKADAKAIFLEALDCNGADELLRFLEQACGTDAALRLRVEELLRAHREAGSFLGGADKQGATCDQPVTERLGTVIGPYKLLEQIGEGGMGTVWMAQQTEPVKRLVALKLIKAGMDSKQVIARFEAERQALALMDHPNIARIFDGGMSESRPYFVMELVKGVPITKYCDEHHLTPRQRLELFVPVCQAVQHAHQKGIIHRDLKPSNVLVALYDGRPVPKVIDFGVAKAAGQSLTDKTLVTGFGAIIGTLEYMSPEQAEINQLDIDTRSDIYSLGVLLYELLTGSTPFSKKDLEKAGMLEMLRVIREDEPSKPSTKLSSSDALPTLSANRGTEPAKLTKLVRGELDWIVMKALEKDRSRRYETANGFAMDVQRYLADEAVQACPPTAGYRLRKFVRRNKGGLSVVGLVLFFVVLLGGGAGWAWRDRAAREAEAARQEAERHAKVAGQVELILAEVDRLEKEQKWPEALAAARRAAAAVAGGEADAQTTERVHARLKDLEFIDRLEQFRMFEFDPEKFGSDWSKWDQELALAFRDYGVEVDAVAVEVAVERLKARPALVIPLAAALDHWGFKRRNYLSVSEADTARWERLVAIANGIDPEPLRSRLRSTRRDQNPETAAELRRLAESINVGGHHPATLIRLAQTLQEASLPDVAVRVLRKAHYVYPGDLHVNVQLGSALAVQKDYEGAIRFYTAALSLQPNQRGLYANLGQVLRNQGNLIEAVVAFRKAIDLGPGLDSSPYQYLGEILRAHGKLDEAVAVYREYVKADERFYDSHLQLGRALRAQGKREEANAAFEKAIELVRKDLERHQNHGGSGYDYLDLASVLHAQGKLDEAVAAYRKAVELEPDASLWYGYLGNALRSQGKLDEATDAYRKAIEISPSYGEACTNLLNALRSQGKLDEAIAFIEKVRDAQIKKLGPEHFETLASTNSLAVGYRAAEQFDKALPLYEATLRLTKAQFGPVNPHTLASMSNLADCYRAADQPDKALPLHEETLRLMKANLGPDHPSALSSMNNLAATYWSLRQLNKSVPLFEELLTLQENMLGRADEKTQMTVANLGVNYKDAGWVGEAISLLEEAYLASKMYATLRWVGMPLLDVYVKAGKPAEAAKLVDELLADARKVLPKDSPQLAGELRLLGLALMEMKRHAAAEPLLRECLAIREKRQPDDWRTFNTQSMLGGALLGQKRYTDAEPLLLKGYEGMKAREKTIPPQGATRIPEALDRLIELCTATDRPNEAKKWRDERAKYPNLAPNLALPPREKKYRKAIELDPKFAIAYCNHGYALRGQKKLDEAIAAYRKAIELDPKLAYAYVGLGALLCDEQKEYDQAIECFRQAFELEPNNADAYGNLGVALYHQGKLDEAIAAYRKAIELGLKHANARRYLRDALAKKAYQFREMKNAAGCLAVAAEFETLKLTDAADKLYNAACIRALCASAILEDPKTPAADAARLAREQADLAMAWLHQAVAAGYKDAPHMKRDKDLDALREHEDFKKLVVAVEAKRPLNDRAWELATHPDPSLRDPTRAVELAEKAVAELPKDANCWNTLGVARYRAGDDKGAVAALMKCRELRTNDAEWTNPFFLAMAHWKLDHKDEATRWYKLAVEWMERKKANSEMMRRVRAEAAELLGIEKKKD